MGERVQDVVLNNFRLRLKILKIMRFLNCVLHLETGGWMDAVHKCPNCTASMSPYITPHHPAPAFCEKGKEASQREVLAGDGGRGVLQE